MAQSTYYLSLTNDGTGVYTATAQRGGSAPSAGTNLPGGGSDLLSGITSDLKTAAIHGLLVCIDDRAAGN